MAGRDFLILIGGMPNRNNIDSKMWNEKKITSYSSNSGITIITCIVILSGAAKNGLLLGVEDTGHITIQHCLTTLLFLLFSLFFCPFVPYCFTSTVSSTPSGSQKMGERMQD